MVQGDTPLDIGPPKQRAVLAALLLAHLTADHELTEFTEPLLAELEPFRDRIAVLGQVGLAGPSAWLPCDCTRCGGIGSAHSTRWHWPAESPSAATVCLRCCGAGYWSAS